MKNNRSQLPLFIFSRWVMNVGVRMIYPFLAVFGRGLGVSVADMSLVVMSKDLVAGFTPVVTSLADYKGRKTGLLIGAALFTGGIGTILLWQQFAGFFLGVGVSSLGAFVFSTTLQAYLGDTVPYEHRGRAIGLIELSWALAFIIGMPLVAHLIESTGWTSPFFFIFALGLICLALIWFFFQADQTANPGPRLILSSFIKVFSWPEARFGLFFSLIICAGNELINLMFGVWMEDSFNLKVAALGAASALIGFAELGGELSTAGLLDRIGKKRAIAAGLLVNGIVGLLLPHLAFSLWLSLAGLFLFYLTFEFTVLSSVVLLTELHPEDRSTFLGINVTAVSVGRAVGAVAAPILYAAGFQFNAILMLLLNLVGIWVLSKISPSDRGSQPTRSY